MYLILGAGRLARHLHHYFQLEGIAQKQWSRKSGQPLEPLLAGADKVLFLVRDDEIRLLKEQYEKLWGNRTLIHCSGSQSIDGMAAAHPLCSFSNELFSHDFYQSIPFVTEKKNRTFNELFPQLKNSSAEIDSKLKPLYHSLCVMSGNFTQILWASVEKKFKSDLGLSSELLKPYMESVFLGLQAQAGTALTGPLARRDLKTIEANLEALKGDDLRTIYEAFLVHFGISVP